LVDLVKYASSAASVPGVSELVPSLKDAIPGLPFDPGILTGALSGRLDPEQIAKEAAVQMVNLAVPGLGVPLRMALPAIEKAGGAIADVITGAKAKRDRRRRNWSGLRGAFNELMDAHPLMIYTEGKQVPSKLFLKTYREKLHNPATWRKTKWYPRGSGQVPYWIDSKTALKNDYAGSGISGKRTGVSYSEKATQPPELVKMLDRYYKLPGTKDRYEKALRNLATVTKKKADELRSAAARPRAARPVMPLAPVARAKPEEVTPMAKKKKKKPAQYEAIITRAKKWNKQKKLAAPKLTQRKEGKYLFTTLRVQVASDKWMDFHNRTRAGKVAGALVDSPTVAGAYSAALGGCSGTVDKLTRVAGAERVLSDAQRALQDRAGKNAAFARHNIAMARKLTRACQLAALGNRNAADYVRRATEIARATPRRGAPLRARSIRSAVAKVRKLYRPAA